MKTSNLIFFFAISFLFSCSDESAEDNEVSNEIETVEFEKDKNLEGLKLNNGSKWKVNHETEVGIQKIEKLLSDFDDDNFEKLGKNIKDELGQIIDLCTMKGEDHDQFHIVLHAMMKESKKLKKGKSTSTDKMNRYVQVYHAHFEE